MVRAAGFTLVEIAITLLIVAVLAAVAMPFTRDWLDANRQWQMVGRLNEGIGQARAVALRNPEALLAGNAGSPVEASRLMYDAGTHALRVVLRQPDGGWPAAGTAPFWQSAPVTGSVALKVGTADFVCLGYDTRGRPVGSDDCPLPAGTSRVVVGVKVGQLESVDVEAW